MRGSGSRCSRGIAFRVILIRYAEAYRLEFADFVKPARSEESSCLTFEDDRGALLLGTPRACRFRRSALRPCERELRERAGR